MRYYFHLTLAALCVAGTIPFVVLTVTQSFFNIVFAITGAVLAQWSINECRVMLRHSRMLQQTHLQAHLAVMGGEYDRKRQMEIMRLQEDIARFRAENIELLSSLEKEYRGYIIEEFAKEEEFPVALSAATERMMLKYGDGIYPAFKDTSEAAMLCLSPSMYVANLDAARIFVSTVRIQ